MEKLIQRLNSGKAEKERNRVITALQNDNVEPFREFLDKARDLKKGGRKLDFHVRGYHEWNKWALRHKLGPEIAGRIFAEVMLHHLAAVNTPSEKLRKSTLGALRHLVELGKASERGQIPAENQEEMLKPVVDQLIKVYRRSTPISAQEEGRNAARDVFKTFSKIRNDFDSFVNDERGVALDDLMAQDIRREMKKRGERLGSDVYFKAYKEQVGTVQSHQFALYSRMQALLDGVASMLTERGEYDSIESLRAEGRRKRKKV